MKERIALWDNMKYLLIVLVVVGHMCDNFTKHSVSGRALFLFIYAFHMPAFIFISGMFHSDKKILQKILFYTGVGFAMKIIFFFDFALVYNLRTWSLLSDSNVPWFMFVLAIYVAVGYLLRKQNKTYILIFSLFISLIVGFDKTIGDYLYLSRAIVFFPFYWLGTMIKPDSLLSFRNRHYKKLVPAAWIIMLIWAVTCVFFVGRIYFMRYMFTGRNSYADVFASSILSPSFRLLAYAISTLCLISLVFIIPARRLPFITEAGSKTLDVLFWHMPIIDVFMWAFQLKILTHTHTGRLELILIGLAVAFLCSLGGPFKYPMKSIKSYCYSVSEK